MSMAKTNVNLLFQDGGCARFAAAAARDVTG